MNNTHQALIEEKVAEFKELGVGYEDSIEPILDVLPNIDHPELGTYSFEKWLTQTLQDTIDTVLEGERERLLQALPKEIIVHEYMPSENTPVRKGWNVYRTAIIKALTQPPCQP